jgi:hypothetical protein
MTQANGGMTFPRKTPRHTREEPRGSKLVIAARAGQPWRRFHGRLGAGSSSAQAHERATERRHSSRAIS